MVYFAIVRYNNVVHSVTKVNSCYVDREQRINYQNVLNFQKKLFQNIFYYYY